MNVKEAEKGKRGRLGLIVLMIIFLGFVMGLIYYLFIQQNPSIGKDGKTFFLIFAIGGTLWIAYILSSS